MTILHPHPRTGVRLRCAAASRAQLTLIATVEDAPADSYPRLGIPLTAQQKRDNRHAECTPDELASIATFARGTFAETAFASADHWTPLDEFTGGDAA